ncbi:hypothetical protein Fmac_023333 [Flemingia macrophylla]|uniref:Mitotic checkpoint protein BUB3 n=1 Tax=Flemingia macrophylla TaxID=520843 RepID=A0ABD1LMU7_9FABA
MASADSRITVITCWCLSYQFSNEGFSFRACVSAPPPPTTLLDGPNTISNSCFTLRHYFTFLNTYDLRTLMCLYLAPIKRICTMRLFDVLSTHAAGQLITGSWDKTLKCWDPRGASGQELTLAGTYPQPERVYSLSLSLDIISLCVRCYPNGTGYALSSVEGMVAMEFFALSEASQAKKYGTFATEGCNGYVNVWYGNNKKRLYQFIAEMDASWLLHRVTHSKRHEQYAIYVRSVNEIEVKPTLQGDF